MHQQIIRKFNECWVPDFREEPNLTGRLGHLKKTRFPIRYIGPLSRFKKEDLPKKYPLMVLLSGPEPQRTLLENKLLSELQLFPGNVLFVQGKVEERQKRDFIQTEEGQIERVNYMQSKELETALNSSDLVLSRSGYTTVMDLAKLGKKAFFIPTPGQYEQVYLAERLEAQNWVPYCRQEEFTLVQLERVSSFKGFTELNTQVDFDSIFSIFSRVKENSEPTSSSLSI
jgi:predicted glycosyltransferase